MRLTCLPKTDPRIMVSEFRPALGHSVDGSGPTLLAGVPRLPIAGLYVKGTPLHTRARAAMRMNETQLVASDRGTSTPRTSNRLAGSRRDCKVIKLSSGC